MGSKEIWNLGYRQGFAFIGILGRSDPQEKIGINQQAQVTSVMRVQTKPTIQAETFRYPKKVEMRIDQEMEDAFDLGVEKVVGDSGAAGQIPGSKS